jgi:hypothetical protein
MEAQATHRIEPLTGKEPDASAAIKLYHKVGTVALVQIFRQVFYHLIEEYLRQLIGRSDISYRLAGCGMLNRDYLANQ